MQSREHHSRHLRTDEDRTEFHLTAPIETTSYWDLADAIHRPIPDKEQVTTYEQQLLGELSRKTSGTRYEGQLSRVIPHIQELVRETFKQLDDNQWEATKAARTTEGDNHGRSQESN
jgi:hypothetical protein